MKKGNLLLASTALSILLFVSSSPSCIQASDIETTRYNVLLRETQSVDDMEKEFEKEGIKIIYFPYTKGISSTQISKALLAVRGE